MGSLSILARCPSFSRFSFDFPVSFLNHSRQISGKVQEYTRIIQIGQGYIADFGNVFRDQKCRVPDSCILSQYFSLRVTPVCRIIWRLEGFLFQNCFLRFKMELRKAIWQTYEGKQTRYLDVLAIVLHSYELLKGFMALKALSGNSTTFLVQTGFWIIKKYSQPLSFRSNQSMEPEQHLQRLFYWPVVGISQNH